jgi:hypothetical protein
MHSSLVRSALVSAAAAACLWAAPGVSSAQQAPSSGAAFDVDQVRAAFAASGYQVGAAHTWGWTQPAFTTLRIADGGTGRVVTVIVYPSADAAGTARLQATHGQAQGATSTGPYLVTGFGPSVWQGNVAMVESTESVLERLYQLQVDRDNGVLDGPPTSAADDERPLIAVDLDFQQALVGGAANL